MTTTNLKAVTDNQSTDVLLGALAALDSKSHLIESERMVKSFMYDTLMERHGLDAAMDEIYFQNLDFAGSQYDALLIALAMQVA